jgi:uncharacterized protein (DUF697 family)
MYWIAFLVPFIIVVAGLVLALTKRRSGVAVTVGADLLGAAALGRRRSSRRLRLALLLVPTVGGIIAAVIIASYQEDNGTDWLIGRTSFLIIAPTLITIVTVLVMAFVPRFAETIPRRTAELAVRTPFRYVSPAELVALIVAVVLLAASTLVFGILAAPNGDHLFYFYGHGYAGGGGIFPGFIYGVPVLLSLVMLIAAVGFSFRRIARAPRPTDEGLREADTAVRTVTTAGITAMASFAVTLTFAILILMASVAFWDVASGNQVDWYGNAVPANSTAQVLSVLSHFGVGLGIGAIIVAIYFLVHAISSAAGVAYRVSTRELVKA